MPQAGLAKPPFGIFMSFDIPSIEAVTDSKRSIPLFRYEVSYILQPSQQFNAQDPAHCQWAFRMSEEQFLTNTKQDFTKLTRVFGPHLASNCHGWVFTGGRFGIKDEHVADILADHAYSLVFDPAEGDLAVYFVDGVAEHTGFVRQNDKGSIVIESKWGPFGVFRHPPEAYAFKGSCAFYRTARPQHALHLQPTAR